MFRKNVKFFFKRDPMKLIFYCFIDSGLFFSEKYDNAGFGRFLIDFFVFKGFTAFC